MIEKINNASFNAGERAVRERPVQQKCEKATPRRGGSGGAAGRENGRTPADFYEEENSAGHGDARGVRGTDQEKDLIVLSTVSAEIY